MKLRKAVCAMATAAVALGLFAGCGSSNDKDVTIGTTEAEATTEASPTTETVTTEAASETESQTEAEAETGKTLVVYYSATGSTKGVAEAIADSTGADIFAIIPVEPYTNDDLNWSNDDSRVSREHNDESLRDVELTQVTPDNWESYDTVYIGYPIWWGIAAWPVNNFVKGNDFTGKTVIPFCTSASSGIGDSGTLLAEMAGTGDWQEGQRFSSGASVSDVEDWVATINK